MILNLYSSQHKCRTIAPASPNSPEAQSVSDIDFYIDGVSMHPDDLAHLKDV